METPFVMVYRVTPLTYLLGRSTVKVPHFAMVNLIAGRQVVPELVQQDVADRCARACPDPCDRFGTVEIRSEQIRTEHSKFQTRFEALLSPDQLANFKAQRENGACSGPGKRFH